MGVAVGLSSAALVRRRTGASGSALAGLLAGTFAVHLAAGYVANLITTAAFLAAGTSTAHKVVDVPYEKPGRSLGAPSPKIPSTQGSPNS